MDALQQEVFQSDIQTEETSELNESRRGGWGVLDDDTMELKQWEIGGGIRSGINYG